MYMSEIHYRWDDKQSISVLRDHSSGNLWVKNYLQLLLWIFCSPSKKEQSIHTLVFLLLDLTFIRERKAGPAGREKQSLGRRMRLLAGRHESRQS
jgi:hypothetical protein